MEKYLYGVKYTIVKEDEYRYYIERTNTVVGLAKVFFTDTCTETATLQSDTYKGYKVEGISYRVRELYDYYKGLFKGANFTDANLVRTSLRKADVRNAVFCNADIQADFTGAKTKGFMLDGADICLTKF